MMTSLSFYAQPFLRPSKLNKNKFGVTSSWVQCQDLLIYSLPFLTNKRQNSTTIGYTFYTHSI